MPLLRVVRERGRGASPFDDSGVPSSLLSSPSEIGSMYASKVLTQGNPQGQHISRGRLHRHLVAAMRVDPSLASVFAQATGSPHPAPTTGTPMQSDAPASDRPFPYGVRPVASASLTLSSLRPHSSAAASPRSTASLRDFLMRPASKSQPLRGADALIADDDLDDHITRPSASSASLMVHAAALPMQPMQDPLPLLFASSSSTVSLADDKEETAPPPQLPVPPRVSRCRRARNSLTTAHLARHTHSQPSFNPFATAFLPAPPGTLDIMCHVSLDALPATLETIRASVLLPFAAVPPHHHPHFVSLIHGIRPPSVPFIFEPHSARIWQEDTTWRKEVRGTKPLADPIATLDAARTARARGHPHWPQFVAAFLARMLAVSAGLQQRGHECLRSVVALQCIREMLRLRSVMRAALRRASQAPPTAVTFPKYGTLAVTPDGWLALDGSARPDPAFLDPTSWCKEKDVAHALVAWTNAEVDVAADDICTALRTTRLSIRAAPHWCRLALLTCATRDVDSAIAIVGVVRFMILRKWMPPVTTSTSQVNKWDSLSPSTHDVDLSYVSDSRDRGFYHHPQALGRDILQRKPTIASSHDGSLTDAASVAMGLDQLCANEFIDRAVAVPDVERCLPGMLDMSRAFARGHDMDCGALTTGEVIDAIHVSTSTPSRRGRRRAPAKNWEDECDEGSWSTVSFHILRRRRVVMSVWTDVLQGDEWCIPISVSSSIDFRLNGARYRLTVIKGDVQCRRVSYNPWSRHLRRKSRALRVDRYEAVGATALCNALDRVYGDVVCLHVLAWLHRGIVRLHDTCVAAAFVPRKSLGGNFVVNRCLPFQICRRMVFARKGHQLFWLPGEGLPPFRVRDCPNGSYQLTEVQLLPPGVELCRAEVAKDFG